MGTRLQRVGFPSKLGRAFYFVLSNSGFWSNGGSEIKEGGKKTKVKHKCAKKNFYTSSRFKTAKIHLLF